MSTETPEVPLEDNEIKYEEENIDDIDDFELPESTTGLTNVSFKDFNLRDELLTNIKTHGFENPSEVQQQAIPRAISGSDLVVQAKSGMGKTAVFVIATLQDSSNTGYVNTLVIAHTHELASQIHKEYSRLAKNMDIRCEVVHGGNNYRTDVATAQSNPTVLIGTPGRINKLLQDRKLDLTHLKHIVLDECDKLLEELSMRNQVQRIFLKTNKNKQIMMFTATLNDSTSLICKKFMKDPYELKVFEEKRTFKNLRQFYLNVDKKEKREKLELLLDQLRFNQVVIFLNNSYDARDLEQHLKAINFPCTLMCGRKVLDDETREQNMKQFRDRTARLLVSTDLTGRGIDVAAVNLVINYDMPLEVNTYQHRVGRAGRFGTDGVAISFISGEEETKMLQDIMNKFTITINPLSDPIPTDLLDDGQA